MISNLTGLIVFIICLTLIFFICKFYAKKQYNLIIAFIILLGLLLRLYAGSDLFLHEWDERYHALVAKNCIDNPFKPTLYKNPVLDYDYRHWTKNHVWLHKPPLTLWLMAISMKFLGINELALRLPSILLSALSIFLIYKIGIMLFDVKIALLAAGLQAINVHLIGLASGRFPVDHIDTIMIAFVTLGAVFVIAQQKRKSLFLLIATGICTGLAFITKSFPAIIIPAIWIAVVYPEEKIKNLIFKFFLLLLIALAIALPWQIYIHHVFPLESAWEASYNFRHVSEVIEGHRHPYYYYIYLLRRIFGIGDLIYIVIIWFLLTGWIKKNYSYVIPLTVWIGLPYLVFSLTATKMPAYVAISYPPLFLIIALFWCRLIQRIINLPKFKYKKTGVVFILLLLIILSFASTVRNLHFFKPYERNPRWAQNLRELDKNIGKRQIVLFNIKYPIEAMFYTSCIAAYPFLPSKEQIQSVKTYGYDIMIYNHTGLIPNDLNGLDNVEIYNP